MPSSEGSWKGIDAQPSSPEQKYPITLSLGVKSGQAYVFTMDDAEARELSEKLSELMLYRAMAKGEKPWEEMNEQERTAEWLTTLDMMHDL